jgi:hypothetical protein
MKTFWDKTLLVVALAAALAACGGKLLYGEADEPSIVFSQPIGTTIPGDPTQTPVTVPQGIITFSFQVPNVPLTGGSTTTTQAGFSITSSMKLNQATLTMPASTNADFNGFDTVTLTIQTASRTQTLATYTKDPNHLPGKTLVLQRAEDAELLEYLVDGGSGTKTITLGISGSGTLPANSWTADTDLDLHIKAAAGWP